MSSKENFKKFVTISCTSKHLSIVSTQVFKQARRNQSHFNTMLHLCKNLKKKKKDSQENQYFLAPV